MVLWVGVDDTDSLRGMCTTYLATELVRDLTVDHDLIGYPRLVRLNPNIPWKTRGNGALALRIGRGAGSPRRVGRIDGRDVLAFPRSRGTDDPDSVRSRVIRLVERWSAFDDPTTNPACVVLARRPAASLYWKTVREVVTRSETRRALRGLGFARGYKNGRGLVGAGAAVAWRPRDRTYEVLTYRKADAWGTPRRVDPASVREMDRAFPSTFNNYDYVNDKVVIAPHSPCPVLFGIRGDEPDDLEPAMERIRGEQPDRWLIFETNQGTDDHIRFDDWSLRPWSATSILGTVCSQPRTRRGGHVLVELRGPATVTAAAYEPSKQFREVVRSLRPGDRVRVWGSVRKEPRTLNLEKLRLIDPAVDSYKLANPRCTTCGKSMKSAGRGAGYRCRACGLRAEEASAPRTIVPRTIRLGFHEPPASARRHLSKPLQRMAPRGEARRSLREETVSDLRGRGRLPPGLPRPKEHPAEIAR